MGDKIFWVALTIALSAGEAATAGLTVIWFAIGALAGLAAAFLGFEIWVQLVVFVAVSGLSLALLRPVTAKHFFTPRSPTNADRVIGKEAQVTQEINNEAGQGQVLILGQTWTARSQLGVVIPAGVMVRVLRIEGVKVFVEAVV